MKIISPWKNGVPPESGLYWIWWEGIEKPLDTVVAQAAFISGAKPPNAKPSDYLWGHIMEPHGWSVVNKDESEAYWYCPMVAPPFPSFPKPEEPRP